MSLGSLRIDERTSGTIKFTHRLLLVMQAPFSADTGQFGLRPALTTLSAVLAGARTTCTQYTTLRTIVVSVTSNIQLGQLSRGNCGCQIEQAGHLQQVGSSEQPYCYRTKSKQKMARKHTSSKWQQHIIGPVD